MKNYATRTAVDVRRATLNSAGVVVYYRMYLRTHVDFAEKQNETKQNAYTTLDVIAAVRGQITFVAVKRSDWRYFLLEKKKKCHGGFRKRLANATHFNNKAYRTFSFNIVNNNNNNMRLR